MKLEIALSIALHMVIVFFTIFSSPLSSKSRFEGEVIRVSITSPSELPVTEAPPTSEIPAAVEDLYEEIEISDPSTAQPIEVKPKPKPKKPTPKPKKKSPPKPKVDSKPAADKPAESEVSGTGAGTPFRGATIDNASFDYPYWFRQAFNKISQNFRNPVASDGTLVCTIYFQVIKSGRVIELRIIESSGFPIFDDACLAAVERAAPFPPLPRNFRDEIIGISIPFKNL